MITQLTVRNYRCLADVTLELGALTVLVGPNASGKSTVLDVFEFVKDALKDSLPAALDRRGGIQHVRRRSNGHPASVAIEVRFDGILDRERGIEGRGRYGFTIRTMPGRAYSVREEHCEAELHGADCAPETVWLRRDVGTVRTYVDDFRVPVLDSRRLLLPAQAVYGGFAPVQDLLTSVGIYSVQPDALREPQEPAAGQVLRPDGSNTASVLREIAADRPRDYDLLKETLLRVAPGVSSPRAQPRGRRLELVFDVDVGASRPRQFDSFLMSDGTLRALGILVALEQRQRLQLVGIEEPEATIHPGALAVLVDALKAASTHTQVIVTTHSPDLLDLVPIDWIQCVRQVRGQTVLAPPSPTALAATRESLMSPGELLRANVLEPDEAEAVAGGRAAR